MTEKTVTPQSEGFTADTPAEMLNDESLVIGDEAQSFQLAQATDGTPAGNEISQANESAEGTGAVQPAAPVPQTIVQIEIGADGSVRLPTGTSLAQAQVSGDDLRLIQPDGTIYVITGAISNIPAIYIGDVQIPAQTLADALAAQGINIAAPGDAGDEAVDSSGINAAATHPGISPPFDLTPLLPPTALAFPILEQPELLQPLVDEPEEPLIIVSIEPAGESNDGAVEDPDLNPGGTSSEENGEFDTFAITIQAGSTQVTDVTFDPTFDYSNLITITGEDESVTYTYVLSADNRTLEIFADGVLVVTLEIDFNPATDMINAGDLGTVDLLVTLESAFPHEFATNVDAVLSGFPVIAEDAGGFNDIDEFSFSIIDDVPQAVADVGGPVIEGALLTVLAASGVLSNDTEGADGATIDGVRAAGGDTTTAVSGGVASAIAGLYGTLTLQADGSYTYQSNPNAITGSVQDVFVYTLIDGDGDLSTTTLTINIDDSGLATPDSSVTVNEAALDLNQDGLDLAPGTVTGSLPGSTAETAGNTVAASGGTGPYTYALVGSATGLYGTIQVNADGTYLYTLTAPVDGPTADDGTNTITGADSFTYQATDANGNTVTGTITIDIIDDVPQAVAPDRAVLENDAGVSASFDLDIDDNVVDNYGADGAGTVRFQSSLAGADSGLTFSGDAIIYSLSGDQLTLTGTADGFIVFTIVLDPSTSTYSVNLFGSVDSLEQLNFSDGGYNFVGGNNSWAGFIPSDESVGSPIDNESPDLLLTPAIGGLDDGTINSSDIAGGVGSGNSVGPGETFRVDFVTDLRGNPADGSGNYDTAANRDHVFDGHYTTNGSSAVFTSTSGSTINIAAFDDDDSNLAVVGDGALDTIVAIVISYDGVSSGLITTGGPVTVNGINYTVTFNPDGTVDIAGVFGTSGAHAIGTEIAIFTADGYNSVEYSYVSGDTFKIGDFGAVVESNDPVNFDVPIEIVDGDGDTAASTLSVTLTPEDEGIQDFSASGVGVVATSTTTDPHIIGSDYNDTLNGDSGDNVLFGGLGNDVLIGGDGDDMLIGDEGVDTLTGDLGADTFVISDTLSIDTITDYVFDIDPAASDVIDLSDILPAGPTGGGGNVLTGYVQYDDATGILSVDADGGGDGFVDVAQLSTGLTAIAIIYEDGTNTDTIGEAVIV